MCKYCEALKKEGSFFREGGHFRNSIVLKKGGYCRGGGGYFQGGDYFWDSAVFQKTFNIPTKSSVELFERLYLV